MVSDRPLPFSEKTYTGDGSTTDFAINMDYQKTSDVEVHVYDATTNHTWSKKTYTTDYTISDHQVKFGSAPASGDLIRVVRKTSRARMESQVSNALHYDAGVVAAAGFTAREGEDKIPAMSWTFGWLVWSTGITVIGLGDAGLGFTTAYMATAYDITHVDVECVIYHNDTSPPTDWKFTLYQVHTPGTAVARAEFPITFDSTVLRSYPHVGQWQEVGTPTTATTVDVNNGQQWYVTFGGSSFDYMAGRVTFRAYRRLPPT